MRKFLKITSSVLLILAVVFSLPNAVLAANITESFDSYVGQDTTLLNGLTGGSGWTGTGWVSSNDGFRVEETGCQAGSVCTKSLPADGDADYYRDATAAVTLGTITFYIKGATGGDHYVSFANDTGGNNPCGTSCKFYFSYSPADGNVNFCATSCVSIGTLTAGSWGLISVEFNTGGAATCADGEARAKLGAGAFSACKAYYGSGATSIIGIGIEFSSFTDREFWVDEITITDEGAAAGAVAEVPSDWFIDF